MGSLLDYFNPNRAGSYGGKHNFSKEVQKQLQSEDSYTLHKPVRKKFLRRKTIVPGAHFQVQADLIDFSSLQSHNEGYKYILTAIDVFSKKASVTLLKNKSADAMLEGLKSVHTQLAPFQKLQTDLGREFFNSKCSVWMRSDNIEHFHSYNYDIKAAVVERFNRSLKSRLWRFFTHQETRRYIDVIQQLVSSYNETYHSAIQRSPNSVNTQNQEVVWHLLYDTPQPKKPKLKRGDRVRLATTRTQFRKSYLPGWTAEIFIVDRVFPDNPPYYQIRDWSGDVLQGTFYEQELQKLSKNPDTFAVESIIKKRTRRRKQEFLVKWQDYPETVNSWIKARDLFHA